MKTAPTLLCGILLAGSLTAGAQTLETLQKEATDRQTACHWNNLAEHLYEQRNRPDELKQATDKATELARRNNDSIQLGRACIYASDLHYMNGDFNAYMQANRQGLHLLNNHNPGLQEVALNNIATAFGEQDEIDSLLHYTRMAIHINQRFGGTPKRLGDECQNMAYAYSILGVADSCLHYNRMTISSYEAAADTLRLLDAYNQMAVFYVKSRNYPQALSYFEQALAMYDHVENPHNRLYVYTNLAALYYRWGQPDKAVEFARKSVNDAKNTHEKATYGKLLCNLGMYLHYDRHYRASIDTLRQALPLVRESFYYLGTAAQLMAANYNMLSQEDSCEYYLNQVDSLARINHFTRGELFYAAKADLLAQQGAYREAVPYAREFIRLDAQKELKESTPRTYHSIAQILEQGAGDYRLASKYNALAYAMLDSIYRKESGESLNRFYAQYQTLEKDLKIASLHLERQQGKQKRVLFVSISALLLMALAAIAFYHRARRIRKEKEAADLLARIRQKDMEFKALTAETRSRLIHSYVEGLETERQRLARELHDNVANELLGIQMQLRPGTQLSPALSERLEALQSEIRDISHELMPPAFKHATLHEITSDYIQRLNLKENIHFHLQLPDEKRLESLSDETSLTIYRIVQEATGNILKHAQATTATIQVDEDKSHLWLTITDDGRGFDPQRKHDGIGLQIIKERVSGLNGTFRIDSAPGQGCRLFIKLPKV